MKKIKLILMALMASFFLHAQPVSEIQELLASDGVADDTYGYSVSISGNYAVVGAYNHNSWRGAVYVYFNDGGNWVEQAKLTASDAEFFDFLGTSVCISGNTVIAGTGNTGSKGAYIFEKPGGGWADMTQTAKLTEPSAADADELGSPVSISGNTAIVGAKGTNFYQGSAYIFEMPVSGWDDMTSTARLYASDGASNDQFSLSVCISNTTAIVGAPEADGTKGATYVFEKPVSGWTSMTETAILTASDAATADYFGQSVGISGSTAIVGIPVNNSLKGSAYIYEKPGSDWADMTETAKLTSSDGTENDYFGYSVDISGDYAIVGAFNDNEEGSAYVFVKPASGWADNTEYSKLTASDAAQNDEFGCSVSISGENAIVGAYASEIYLGAAYIFGPEIFVHICNFTVNLKDSNGDPLAGGSLEYREGGGSGWQSADEFSDGVFCIYTDREQVGLRMTYGPQVQKVSAVPTNEEYTFSTLLVTVRLQTAFKVFIDGGVVDYTSDGWHRFGITGDNGPGLVKQEMLPVQYTFRMNYQGDTENKTVHISPLLFVIPFLLEDLKSGIASESNDVQLATYPNPFSGNTTIAFSLEKAEEVSIAVFDVNGKLIEVIHEGMLEEGNHKLNWNASEVQKGIYLIRFISNEKVYSKNIVKI